MIEEFKFTIDDKQFTFDANGSPAFKYGISEVLSTKNTDITFGQDWYKKGFKVFPLLNKIEFNSLQSGISNCVKSILDEKGIDISKFELNKYHLFIPNDTIHYEVVRRTRDLFPSDFDFHINKFYMKLSELLGLELTDINPHNGERMHIIIRINRPGSNDFNPPHKDVYESVDRDEHINKFVNFWIPISGVNMKSSLPLVPGSHLLSEDKILRTFEGGTIQKQKYHVRSIMEWDGQNNLYRSNIGYGNVLIFSSHLIHGCAVNEQEDETRVALEFRLFKK